MHSIVWIDNTWRIRYSKYSGNGSGFLLRIDISTVTHAMILVASVPHISYDQSDVTHSVRVLYSRLLVHGTWFFFSPPRALIFVGTT